MKKERLKKRLLSLGMAAVLLGTQVFGGGSVRAAEEEEKKTTADLRLVFTTDLHGQVNNVDYATGALFNTGGLAKAATLINEARGEVGASNVLTFDLGDVLYDYTTDYIYEYDETAIQPIYSAMATIGYDAITLGNHDFEYTLPYIQNQLIATGLQDKVVVSNVKDANTGASIWNENKIIEKTLTTESGNNITVKVGIIGETIPKLSERRCDYTGVLVGEDIVQNVNKETQLLKSQGADIVVVLAHSGVGEEVPEAMAEDVGYALTKIDGVDAVLCGHRHTNFCADGTTKYDKYPGVDTKKGLVNGKNLVMVSNIGKGIGVVDLTISNDTGANEIVERKSSIRKVKADTKADANISNNFMGEWAKTFIADSTEILCEMDSATRLENYFGTLEDSGVTQLMNDIGISYGMLYKNNEKTEYANWPIVAASRYLKYGAGGGDDFYDIKDNFTRSNMYQVMNYRVQFWTYAITGSQLREWLEWSASAYETQGDNLFDVTKNASGSTIVVTGASIGDNPMQNLLQEDWETNWDHLYFFDGVEYQIDTSVKPRYDYNGKKINDTLRVKEMTRNGQPIQDSDQILFVVNRLAAHVIPDQFKVTELGHLGAAKARTYIEEYLERESLCGTMKIQEDDNWSISHSNEYQYMVKAGEAAAELAETKDWIEELLDSSEDFYYYRADFSNLDTSDTTGPSLVLKTLNDEETNNDVKVAIQTTDKSGIFSLKYLKGKYTANSSVWDNANRIEGHFNCSENGIYSVLSTDLHGNKTIKYIRINNVNKSILQAPKVNTYTNRKQYIEGTAEPGATIYFQVEDGTVYKSLVKEDGTFKYALPPQKSGSKVLVYLTDDQGRASARTVVEVKRTGPNKPIMDKLVTKSRKVSGNLNDTNVYPVFIIADQKTVYLQADGTEDLYKISDFYNEKYKIVKKKITIKEDGSYSFKLPKLLPAETQVKIKTLDAIGRDSLGTSKKVQQTEPAKPTADEVTNLSKKVKVYSEEKCTSASVQVKKKTYTVKKSKYLSGKKLYRYTVTIPRTDSGVKVKVYLNNIKGQSPVLKLTKKEKAPDTPTVNKVRKIKKITGKVHIVEAAVKAASSASIATGGAVSADGESEKDTTATVANTKTKVFVWVNKKKYTAKITEAGIFKVKLKKKLKKGDKIVVQAKNSLGKSLKRKIKV